MLKWNLNKYYNKKLIRHILVLFLLILKILNNGR